MLQTNDLLFTQHSNNLSEAVGSMGNVAPGDPDNTVPRVNHVESNVLFQTIQELDNYTRIIMFSGKIIEVVDSRTTRIYNVYLRCDLIYSSVASLVPNKLYLDLAVTPAGKSIVPINVLPYIPVFNYYTFSFDFTTTIGFTCGKSTIQANLYLGKTPGEQIVNGDTLRLEFYLYKPYIGNIPFVETLYRVYKAPDGLTEVTELSGVFQVSETQGYPMVLKSVREFVDSTDVLTRYLNTYISIKDLTATDLNIGISTKKFTDDYFDQFYVVNFIATTTLGDSISGTYTIPVNRRWNAKPSNLTYIYIDLNHS